jgi:MoaA/NifB/PqqE/SkfB family radical SAM enzyme
MHTCADDALDDFEIYMRKIDFIHLEFTNHCTYKCKMCRHDAMRRNKGFISDNDLEWALLNVAQNCHQYCGVIQLQGTGEALLDKNLPQKISLVRKYLPKADIGINTTLGVEHPDFTLEDLVKSGLTHINVSVRGATPRKYEWVHGIDRFDLVFGKLSLLSELRNKYCGTFSVYIRGPFINVHSDSIFYSTDEEMEYFLQECSRLNLSHERGFINNIATMNHNKLKEAVLPCSIYKNRLSRVLNINYDLTVVPCSLVIDQEIVLGNLKKQTLREIYYSRTWSNFCDAHRKMTTKIDYPFCYHCNNETYKWERRRP